MAEPPAISNINMRNADAYFGKLAMTNYYQLFITPGWTNYERGFGQYLKDQDNKYGLDFNQIQTSIGLLCSEANLPASSFATSEVKDNFMGITQEFAHTRLFTDIDLTFYIDRDYNVLRFFEAWMDYVSGGSQIAAGSDPRPNVYRRFNYPNYYKNNGIYIKKFEKNWNFSQAPNITYQLINAFPKSMASIPVSYGDADLMRVSVTFNYDRYIVYRRYAPITDVDGKKNAETTSTANPVASQASETTALGNSISELEELRRKATIESLSKTAGGRAILEGRGTTDFARNLYDNLNRPK